MVAVELEGVFVQPLIGSAELKSPGIEDWDSVLSKLNVVGKIRPAKSAAIADFEAATGFSLPNSYRNYCTGSDPTGAPFSLR